MLKNILGSFVFLVCLVFLSGCATYDRMTAEEYDENKSAAWGQAYINFIERQLSDKGQYEYQYGDKPDRTRDIKLDWEKSNACLTPDEEWPNRSLNFFDKSSNTLGKMIDERYGVHYEIKSAYYYWYDITNRADVTSYRQLLLVGDGTQVLRFNITEHVSRECTLSSPRGKYSREFSLQSYGDLPVSLERLKQPLTPENRPIFLEAMAIMDNIKSASISRYAESRAEASASAEARSAYYAQKNREKAERSAAHYAETVERVNKNMEFFTQTTNYVEQQNEINRRNSSTSSPSSSYTRSNNSSSSTPSNKEWQDNEVKRVYASAKKSEVFEKAMDNSAAKKSPETKGLRYTEISIEAKGTTSMYFEYDQALDLAETNAANEAANLCAGHSARLMKGSGTMAKKNCVQNRNDEHKCNVTMLFTCQK